MDSAVLERAVPYNPDQVSFATPANAGAHRLAWWMAPNPDYSIVQLTRAGVCVSAIDRLISGEVIPADDHACAIARATGGLVLPMDWERKPTGSWGDRPTPHNEMQGA